jgi:hypothetical protein
MGVTSQGFGQEGYQLDVSDLGPMAKPQPYQQDFAVGVPYYLPFATPYRDSWEVFRDDPVSIRQLVAMRRQDGQARALYRLLTMPILAALKNADVVQPQGVKGGDKEAQHCKDLLFLPKSGGGMTYSVKRFIRQMTLALFDGFSAFEMIYHVPDTGPLKGKIAIRELGWRPSETLTFLLDGQGQFNGFRQRTFFQGRAIDVKIPRETAIYYAQEEAERPFYGVSLFESAFYHWDKKAKLYYIVHLAAQRAAVGTRIGTMPPNPHVADKNNFIAQLANLGLAQWMALPSSDWQVTNLKEEGGFDFLGLINHHNSQMSKSVLAPWFDEQQGAGSGETTLVDFGQQSDASYLMLLESILEDMGNIISNEIFPRFIDWNFGTARYPEFKWGALTAEQKAAIQDTFDKLAGAGPQANVTPEFMLELEEKFAAELGLDIDYDKIKQQREQQQAAMEAQQAAFGPGGGGFGGGFPGQGGPPGQGPPGGPPGAGQNAGGNAGGPQGGGIPPELMPPNFQQFQASAEQALDAIGLGATP